MSEDAQEALLAYGWLGNILELENVIHHALIVCRDGVVRAGDFRFSPLTRFGPTIQPPVAPQRVDALSKRRRPFMSIASRRCRKHSMVCLIDSAQPELFRTVESTLVHRAFAHCRNNQVRTARLLGVTRNTLRTLL